MRTSLRAQMTALRPSELVLPSQGISNLTKKVLMATLRNPRVNNLTLGTSFWSAVKTVQELKAAAYFKGLYFQPHSSKSRLREVSKPFVWVHSSCVTTSNTRCYLSACNYISIVCFLKRSVFRQCYTKIGIKSFGYT